MPAFRYRDFVLCTRRRALFYSQKISTPHDNSQNYPGELTIWEDEEPASAVELFLAAAEKEILKNRTKWDAQQERWEKNRTKNLNLAARRPASSCRRVVVAAASPPPRSCLLTRHHAIRRRRRRRPASRDGRRTATRRWPRSPS